MLALSTEPLQGLTYCCSYGKCQIVFALFIRHVDRGRERPRFYRVLAWLFSESLLWLLHLVHLCRVSVWWYEAWEYRDSPQNSFPVSQLLSIRPCKLHRDLMRNIGKRSWADIGHVTIILFWIPTDQRVKKTKSNCHMLVNFVQVVSVCYTLKDVEMKLRAYNTKK